MERCESFLLRASGSAAHPHGDAVWMRNSSLNAASGHEPYALYARDAEGLGQGDEKQLTAKGRKEKQG